MRQESATLARHARDDGKPLELDFMVGVSPGLGRSSLQWGFLSQSSRAAGYPMVEFVAGRGRFYSADQWIDASFPPAADISRQSFQFNRVCGLATAGGVRDLRFLPRS